ncbi:MAG TPA: sugar transferase [Gaiellaceae bacterium]|jgi:lipopolysaccharide/colanic/teichoic acid biosynthesis glycosyltransferase
MLDIAVSTSLLLLLMPFFVVIAAIIKLESRGGLFYPAERVGRHGETFAMLKFRKMTGDATGSSLTAVDDPRFTRIGSILSRSKIDELPQLWNVLRGQMSLVGPRPEAPEFVERRRAEYARILTVRPGMTGFSQLAFAEEIAILDPDNRVGHYETAILPQKLALDSMYVQRHSVRDDVRVLWWTLFAVVFRRHVAVHRSTAKLNIRRRPVVRGHAERERRPA